MDRSIRRRIVSKSQYYRLTVDGRKQLAVKTDRWTKLVGAGNRVLRPAEAPATTGGAAARDSGAPGS